MVLNVGIKTAYRIEIMINQQLLVMTELKIGLLIEISLDKKNKPYIKN
jgi:hypothetical protein